jgi:nitroreductase
MPQMELTEAVHRRRMVRRYDPDRPVDQAKVDELLDMAVRAPSAGFSQGWQFLVLDTSGDRELFWTTTSTADDPADSWLLGMRTAPLLILALSDKDAYLDRYAEPDKGWSDRDEARWPVPYWDIDTGMASMIILLSAVDQGLVSCFFGVPPAYHDATRAAFDIPTRLRFVGVISIGYRAPDRLSPSLKRGRRDIAEVVSYGRYDHRRAIESPGGGTVEV